MIEEELLMMMMYHVRVLGWRGVVVADVRVLGRQGVDAVG